VITRSQENGQPIGSSPKGTQRDFRPIARPKAEIWPKFRIARYPGTFALEAVDAKVLYTYAPNLNEVERVNGIASLSPLDNKTFSKISPSDVFSGRSQRWPFMQLRPSQR
jgi:hypothetical protein